MDNEKFPTLNAFFIEDENEPGNFLIPVIDINGERVTMTNIKDDKIDMFKHIAGSIGAQTGQKVFYAEFEKPSHLEEIKEPEHSHPLIQALVSQVVGLIDKVLEEKGIDVNTKADTPPSNKERLH